MKAVCIIYSPELIWEDINMSIYYIKYHEFVHDNTPIATICHHPPLS